MNDVSIAIVQIVLGLLALVAGGELLVRGSSLLAAVVRISPLVIGLTVVAFGTSARTGRESSGGIRRQDGSGNRKRGRKQHLQRAIRTGSLCGNRPAHRVATADSLGCPVDDCRIGDAACFRLGWKTRSTRRTNTLRLSIGVCDVVDSTKSPRRPGFKQQRYSRCPKVHKFPKRGCQSRIDLCGPRTSGSRCPRTGWRRLSSLRPCWESAN